MPRLASSTFSSVSPAQLTEKLPSIRVNRRGSTRLRSGHVWVYRSDLLEDPASPAGALVQAVDPNGNLLGTAFYSSVSQIALRLLSRSALSTEQLENTISARLRQAIAYRRRVVADSNAYRVVFSEADELPGLIVDRYNDVLSMQVLTQAMDRDDMRQAAVATLVQEFAPAGIVERVDSRIREREALPPAEAALRYGEKASAIFTMNGLRFHYDGLGGQKTGAFLDQRENYAAAAGFAKGHALDVFTYQGGFALHLARVCERVTAVDSSRPALEMAEQNEGLNATSFIGGPIEWIEGNAFDVLKDYSTAGQHYDVIVLDPPAFAKSSRAVETALRGYKELNLRALRMLRRDGILVTCSCSYHVSEGEFLQMVNAASLDAHRRIRLLERRGQAKDHPVIPAVPETAYLKCMIFNVNN